MTDSNDFNRLESNKTVVLTIAGSDPSGGAGIQADLKTFHQFGCFGTSVLTLITAQNTQGVSAVELLDERLVLAQLDAVLSDMPIQAVKTGAIGSAALVREIAQRWRNSGQSRQPNLVVDPVMISKHGHSLADDDFAAAVKEFLLPLAQVITPNRFEAAALAGVQIQCRDSAISAAQQLAAFGPTAVVIKQCERACDLLWLAGEPHFLTTDPIDTKATHGTGCSFSAAITALVACGHELRLAIEQAKSWTHRAMIESWQLGTGPVSPLHFHVPTS